MNRQISSGDSVLEEVLYGLSESSPSLPPAPLKTRSSQKHKPLKKLKKHIRLKKYQSNVFDGAMTLSGRSIKFHKIFDIPESEVLIRTFPCALKAEILFQGTLYVSAHYICFYARLANRRKTIKIATNSIVAITREKTAVIFPNAIGIRDDKQKYVFGSMLSRESTLKILVDLWKTALADKENGEIFDAVQASRAFFKSSSDSDLTALDTPVSRHSGQEMNLKRYPLRELSGASSPSFESPFNVKSSSVPVTSSHVKPVWADLLIKFLLLFKLQLSSHSGHALDRTLVIICALVSLCLVYVLYLAYQIHAIQNSISQKLRELLDAGIPGIVDT